MIISNSTIPGLKIVDPELRGDERGFFSRTFCLREFEAEGLSPRFVQQNMSFSKFKGTLRGLHYQLPPAQEAKLVRCTRGALWDVGLDLRKDSATYGKWFGTELSAENRRALYLPEGIAHGFVSLTDDCEIFYSVSSYYSPELERGIRWDDQRFSIQWPIAPKVISDRDRAHPNFSEDWL